MHDLTDEQKKFLDANGNIVLHACPGSGKTFVVAQKLMQYINGWSRPHQGVAVLSFTNVASEEIQKQASELGSNGFQIEYPHYVGTLDSFINSFILLRFGYLMMDEPKRPTIAIKDIFSVPYTYWRKECRQKGCPDDIQSFRWGMDGQLYRKKEKVVCPPNPNRKHPPCYECKQVLLKRGFIFQSEVAALSYLLLKKHPEIAASIASRFPILLIDEAQDTSVEQMAILDQLSQAGIESMFLVGDPDQSIYEWRDATPECFIHKMNCEEWMTLPLTANFRSSQHVCNATQAFAKSLETRPPSTSKSEFSDYNQKPILLFYEGSIEHCKTRLVEKFLQLCADNNIETNSKNIAVVTRSKVYSDTDISGLWKSSEVEFLAQAAYEWFYGSRKRAYELCEKAVFPLVIMEYREIKISIENDVEEIMPYELWRLIVIEVLVNLPNVNQPLGSWITQANEILKEVLAKMNVTIRPNYQIADSMKIKAWDKKVPHFKNIPLKNYFESKCKDNYTLASVHGVKGETYDALMLIVEARTGQTLTPTFLNDKDIGQELMRIAYVAMTRPRKLLVVAMPDVKSRTVHPRFPKDKWDYISI